MTSLWRLKSCVQRPDTASLRYCRGQPSRDPIPYIVRWSFRPSSEARFRRRLGCSFDICQVASIALFQIERPGRSRPAKAFNAAQVAAERPQLRALGQQQLRATVGGFPRSRQMSWLAFPGQSGSDNRRVRPSKASPRAEAKRSRLPQSDRRSRRRQTVMLGYDQISRAFTKTTHSAPISVSRPDCVGRLVRAETSDTRLGGKRQFSYGYPFGHHDLLAHDCVLPCSSSMTYQARPFQRTT